MIDPGLKEKVVVVTGGNNPRGIGAATAKAFAAQGTSVLVHYFRSRIESGGQETVTDTGGVPGAALYRALQTRSADELVGEIRGQGGRVDAWESDLSNPDNLGQVLDRAEQILGPVDVLVNNAALCEPDTFLPGKAPERDRHFGFGQRTISAESHDRHFAVNSRAVALLTAEFARRHIARGATNGRIINVSTDGASGYPDEISYWASKHALESYTRAAAIELGPYGITVNIVSPGPVQTGWMPPEMVDKIAPQIPLRRVGQPEDVADVIVFLASAQARWITGQLLYVGGGNRMAL